MGDTVVFTVSLDQHDEAPAPPPFSRIFAEALVATLRSDVWSRRWVIVVTAGVAAIAAVATVALLVGPSLSAGGGTGLLVMTALVAFLTGAINGARAAVAMPSDAVSLSDRVARVLGNVVAASLMTSLGLVVVAPFVWWVAQEQGMTEVQVVPLIAVLGFEVVVAVALGHSTAVWSRERRPVLAAGIVALALMGGPVLAFLATIPFVTAVDRVVEYRFSAGLIDEAGRFYPVRDCSYTVSHQTRAHTDRTWMVLAASPVVAVLDAPEQTPAGLVAAPHGSLAAAQAQLRDIRVGPAVYLGDCYTLQPLTTVEAGIEARYAASGPMSGFGLAVHGALALAALGVAVSRRKRW